MYGHRLSGSPIFDFSEVHNQQENLYKEQAKACLANECRIGVPNRLHIFVLLSSDNTELGKISSSYQINDNKFIEREAEAPNMF